MKISLRIIGVMGLVLFATLFAITFSVPDVVEKSAKEFVKKQIEEQIKGKYQEIMASSFTDKVLHIAGSLGYDEKKLREDIIKNLPENIASVIATICNYECDRKKNIAKSLTADYMERIANIQVAQKQLGNIIKGKYLDIVDRLQTDLRVFLGSNAVMFFILLSISFLKPRAISHLFLPAIFLLISTITASLIYIFGQDWFYTILYNGYMGFSYLAYILVIFGFLIDIALNKARVTTEIINGILNVIGSTISVMPC